MIICYGIYKPYLQHINLCKFQESFLHVLNIYARMKTKFIRVNEVPYMTKPLRKAIMTRSRHENRYLKTKLFSDKDIFKKQRNYCNTREKGKYFIKILT